MVQLQSYQRARNFAEQKVWKCLECGKDIYNGKDLYSRRFCKVDCKKEYFKQL